MWIGASGGAQAHDFASSSGRDRSQAVRGDAEDVTARLRGACERVEELLERVHAVHETPLQRRRRGAAEVAVGVEDRQQREPDLRGFRGADDAPCELRQDRRTACRAGRGARNGIRRPMRSRAFAISTYACAAIASNASASSRSTAVHMACRQVQKLSSRFVDGIPVRPAIARWNACECTFAIAGMTGPFRRSSVARPARVSTCAMRPSSSMASATSVCQPSSSSAAGASNVFIDAVRG